MNKYIDLSNIKLMSSCPKLTPTPIMVRTGTRSPEEVDGAEALRGDFRNGRGKDSIVNKYSFEGKM